MSKNHSADGLRGFASLAVFFSHVFIAFFPVAFVPWIPSVAQADAPAGMLDTLLSLPLISTLWNGSSAVSVFFVLSGYVLCKRFVDTQSLDVVRSLASRRYLRLGMPVAASILLAWAIAKAGWIHASEVAALSGSDWLHWLAIDGLTFTDALRDAAYGALLDGTSRFNGVLWTMRIELIGSFMIFAYSLLATRGLQRAIIWSVLLLLAVFLSPANWPHYLAFLLGALLAQRAVRVKQPLAWGAVLLSLYLGGFSTNEIYAPFREIPLDPQVIRSLLGACAGALTLIAVQAGLGRTLLECNLGQFLGRISYALYLVHTPVILSAGCALYLYGVTQLGVSRSVAVVMVIAVLLPLTIIVAVMFERLVDRPAIAIGKRWLGVRNASDSRNGECASG